MTPDDGMLIRTDQALNSLSDAPGSLWGQWQRAQPPRTPPQINETCCCRLELIDSQLKADKAFNGARRTPRLYDCHISPSVAVRKG